MDYTQPRGRDLAELGTVVAIMGYILDHAVTVQHAGQTLRLFNATHHPMKMGCLNAAGNGIDEIARLDQSAYVAKSIIREREDRMPDGSIFIHTFYTCSSEVVLSAIATAKAQFGVITLSSDEYRVAEGYKNTILTPIKIKGFEHLWIYEWNKFAVPTYYNYDRD